jgi:deoxycytidylate deaminase
MEGYLSADEKLTNEESGMSSESETTRSASSSDYNTSLMSNEGNVPSTLSSKLDSVSNITRDEVSFNRLFMKFAIDVSQRSEDPKTQVGCVITSMDNIILGFGYNAYYGGAIEVPMTTNEKGETVRDCSYITHAEVNAITHNSQSLRGQKLIVYTTRVPCTNCMSILCQYNIFAIFFCTDANKPENYSGTRIICKSLKIPLIHYNSFFSKTIEVGDIENIERSCSGYISSEKHVYKFDNLNDETSCCYDQDFLLILSRGFILELLKICKLSGDGSTALQSPFNTIKEHIFKNMTRKRSVIIKSKVI